MSIVTPDSSAPLLFTVEEAADRCRISRAQMFRLVQRGQVATLKIGRSRRVSAQALAEFVAQLEAEQAEAVRVGGDAA